MNSVHAFQCNHWLPLVFLSYTISVLGAFCALEWGSQIPRARGWVLASRVAGAAIAMGGGAIWSMHFIAMIACRLPVPVSYSGLQTFGSLFVAILVTGIGLYTVGRGKASTSRLLAGGAFTGLGVAAMHYTGMAAMRLPATITYKPSLVVASVLIAIVAATAALWIAFHMGSGLPRLMSSLVMGLAVCGMHYTGMAAATFIPTGGGIDAPPGTLRTEGLAYVVFGLTLFVLALLSMGSRISGRKETEGALREAHGDLERLVEERTGELARTNEELRAENAERKRIDAALQASEIRYRGIIESALDAVVAMDADGKITAWNAQAEKIFGWSKEEAIGRGLAETIIPARLRDGHHGGLRHYHATGEGPILDKRIEISALRRDGSEFPVDLAISAARSGGTVTFSGFIRDITERKTLEEQFRQSQKMEAVGTLAGGVAHDFNNLLTTILGYSELALGELQADNPIRADIEEIKKAGERAAQLTKQLLAFSRKQIVELKVLDLNAILADMDRMLRRLVGEDIEIVTAADPALGHVKADRGQIEQIVMNLAVNARDAMPRGGKLTIESGNIEARGRHAREGFQVAPGPYVVLSVTDTGAGMDSETRARIFEPFFTTKEKGQGTGLGLSTVYGIVKQSGGYIWVESEPGKGASFKIYLPRVDQDVDAVVPADTSAPHGGPETILLVEDEDAVRRLVHSTLSRQGYPVLEARNGEEAMRIAADFGGVIDLVLTDGVMPGLPVGDMIEGLRALWPEARTLVMSGYTSETIVRRGILESDMAFLEKPFSSTALLQKVREVLDAA